ncbi:GIY-YIG nuclease family protein [Solibacillus sp. FSL W8-0474]|uniref:GIY-YIG nuclease family protein n=1 Tax=Solibacillus sp. FSL W8-0474 TaxID=2975336 RepID=UPI0030F8D24D
MTIVKKAKQSMKGKVSGPVPFLFILFFVGSVVWQLLVNHPVLTFFSGVLITILILYIWQERRKQAEIRRQELLRYNLALQRKVVQKMRDCLNKILRLEKHNLSKVDLNRKKRLKESFYNLYGDMYAGYVYIIEEGSNGYVKIGKANDPMKRVVNGLGAKSPYAIEVLHLIPTHVPLDVEKWFHKTYQKERLNGEWFRLSDAQKAEIQAGDYPIELLELINSRPATALLHHQLDDVKQKKHNKKTS